MEILKTRTKALIRAQFDPAKTLRQLIKDRACFRASIHAALVVFLFL